jgi:hypothetical protein
MAQPMVVGLLEAAKAAAVRLKAAYVKYASVCAEPNSKKQKGYGKDTVRPVTIKQLVDAEQPHPDAEFKVDGDPISQVRRSSNDDY